MVWEPDSQWGPQYEGLGTRLSVRSPVWGFGNQTLSEVPSMRVWKLDSQWGPQYESLGTRLSVRSPVWESGNQTNKDQIGKVRIQNYCLFISLLEYVHASMHAWHYIDLWVVWLLPHPLRLFDLIVTTPPQVGFDCYHTPSGCLIWLLPHPLRLFVLHTFVYVNCESLLPGLCWHCLLSQWTWRNLIHKPTLPALGLTPEYRGREMHVCTVDYLGTTCTVADVASLG